MSLSLYFVALCARSRRMARSWLALTSKSVVQRDFCNHQESPDYLHFFQITHNFFKDTLWWVIPTNHIKTFERYLLFQKILPRTGSPDSFRLEIMHEGSTPQNSLEKPNSIHNTDKALSIFPLHARHDKVFSIFMMPWTYNTERWDMKRAAKQNVTTETSA